MAICPNCGEESPDRFRFCGVCATPLRVQPAPSQEARKTVTVVFCDLVGSTTLGEHLDSESLKDVLDRYFSEMRGVLEHHGGVIEKYQGDAMLAVFGLPRVHEDDALRAVRAVWDMKQRLASINPELIQTWGVTLHTRTGINTGGVIVGDPSSGQRLATGDAMNLAARLEQVAPADEVLLSEMTFRLVRGAVEVQAVEPLLLKGKSERVPAFRLLAVYPGAEAIRRRVDARMVGRRSELEAILDEFESAVRQRTGRLVTVLGEAGVGKTTLLRETMSHLDTEAKVVSGRCPSYGAGTFWPLGEALRAALGITATDTPEMVLARLDSFLGEEDTDGVDDRIASVLMVTEATYPIEETFWATRRFFESLTQEGPLVLIFEDLHWAQQGLLDLLEHLVNNITTVPILILCSARPELFEQHPGWLDERPDTARLDLLPLSEQDIDALIEGLLGTAPLAPFAKARIAIAAQGNPLFAEQMVAMWLDEGMLALRDNIWVLADPSTTIPPSISALLSSRLDRLPQNQRAIVATGAVIGQVFYREALQQLAPETAANSLRQDLSELDSKQFIRPVTSDLALAAYAFRHALIRDAAYDGMLKRTRAQLHEAFSSWLEHHVGQRAGEYEEILGHHLEQAYLHLQALGGSADHAQEIAKRAGQRLSSAGRRAFARGDMPGAARLLKRVADLLPSSDPDRVKILPDLGAALVEAGELATAGAVLDEAVTLARTLGNEVVAAYARLERLRLTWLFDPEGANLLETSAEAEHLLQLFERWDDERGLAKTWNVIGHAQWDLGRVTAAEDAWERATRHADAADDRRERAESLSWLALASRFGPTPAPDGIERCNRILEYANGDRKIEAHTFDARCVLEAMLGRFDDARETARRAHVLYDELGLKLMGANVVQNSGYVEILADDPVAAEREYRWGYELLSAMDEKGFLSAVAAQIAEALYEQGRMGEAEEYTRVSEQAASDDDFSSQAMWRSVRAKAQAHRGHLVEAHNLATEAVTLVRHTGVWIDSGDIVMDLAVVQRAAGLAARAAETAEEAVSLYRRKGNVVSAEKARRLLAEIGSDA